MIRIIIIIMIRIINIPAARNNSYLLPESLDFVVGVRVFSVDVSSSEIIFNFMQNYIKYEDC